MAWEVFTGVSVDENGNPNDGGHTKHYAAHVETDKHIPIGFLRKGDAESAVRLLAKECPGDGVTSMEEMQLLLTIHFGKLTNIRKRLAEECLMW